ncbi:flagellar protein FlgN [Cobetia amphilecti]|nr:hypothetical protein C8233_01875 [Halomonas sp. SF2003]UTV88282.1 flagellar protein FlgN [Cobetia litoralis]
MTLDDASTALLGEIFSGLEQELNDFIALLEEEQRLLGQRLPSAADLETSREAKLANAARLEALESRRRSWLSSAGLTNDPLELHTVLASQPLLATQWWHLVTLTRRAQARNRLNGELIGQRMALHSKILDSLHQRSPGHYGADGRPAAGASRLNVSA